MNIEAENLDSLRKLVRELQAENTILKEKLKKANIAYLESNVFEEKIEDTSEYDPDQGERIVVKFITKEMVNKYFAMFWVRTEVYAKLVGMVDISHNAIIVGMIELVQSSVVKRFDVKIVRIQSGLNLLQEKLWNIWWGIRKIVQML